MNINFGTEGYVVRYLQTFLKDNYSKELVVTGKFNQETHEALVNYLNLPNVELTSVVLKELYERFPDLSRLFILQEDLNELIFTSKIIDKETSDFITLAIEEIKEYIESVGWQVDEYKDYIDWMFDINQDNSVDKMDENLIHSYLFNGAELTEEQRERADLDGDKRITTKDLQLMSDYLTNNKLKIKVSACNRENYFPNKDMLPMINLFDGQFSYFMAFRSETKESAAEDFIDNDPSGDYKLCIIKCKPNTKYTIGHGSTKKEKIIVGSYTGKRTNMKASRLRNIVEQEVPAGNVFIYETQEDAKYIVIQCASNMGHLTNMKEVRVPVKLGDLNFDGKVDQADKKILADYLYYPEESGLRPKLTKKQLFVADTDNDGAEINERDMTQMNRYLNGEIVDLGTKDYVYYVPGDLKENDRVAKLLVIEGDATIETVGTKEHEGVELPVTRSKYGINFKAFTEDPWIIHDKFIPYLLGMAIHKYSRTEEITYVQDILSALYPDTADTYVAGHYTENMRDLILEYQRSQSTLSLGDFDGDGKITDYDINYLQEYLNGQREFNNIEKVLADVNNDGKIDETDLRIMKQYKDGLNDTLDLYTDQFYLGWIDPQTEALMLQELSGIKTINEVGWR